MPLEWEDLKRRRSNALLGSWFLSARRGDVSSRHFHVSVIVAIDTQHLAHLLGRINAAAANVLFGRGDVSELLFGQRLVIFGSVDKREGNGIELVVNGRHKATMAPKGALSGFASPVRRTVADSLPHAIAIQTLDDCA